MRILTIFLSLLFLSTFLIAQQKYLVSPTNDWIPINKDKSPSAVIAKYYKDKLPSSTTGECTNKGIFGYPPDRYAWNLGNTAMHKDVIGQWFEAKASGTIDTVFWYNGWSYVGAKDSMVFLRIHESRVGYHFGPGVPPYPAACQFWVIGLTHSIRIMELLPFPMTPQIQPGTQQSTQKAEQFQPPDPPSAMQNGARWVTEPSIDQTLITLLIYQSQ